MNTYQVELDSDDLSMLIQMLHGELARRIGLNVLAAEKLDVNSGRMRKKARETMAHHPLMEARLRRLKGMFEVLSRLERGLPINDQ